MCNLFFSTSKVQKATPKSNRIVLFYSWRINYYKRKSIMSNVCIAILKGTIKQI